jgi:hypothetical protein
MMMVWFSAPGSKISGKGVDTLRKSITSRSHNLIVIFGLFSPTSGSE